MKCPSCSFENKEPNRYQYSPATIDKLEIFDESDILCCENCGFGMIEKDVDEEVLQRYYFSDYSGKARKQTETKSLDTRTNYSFDIRSVSQMTLIKQYFNLQPNATVVEIGSGTGGFLFLLQQMGFKGKYIAFEPQEQAYEFITNLGGKVERENFNLECAEKYKDLADLVVMSHSLEHFNPGKIAEIMDGVRTMLRKGGCFFCEVPNANLQLYPNAGEMVVPHLSFFSKDALKNFIEKAEMKLMFINACGDNQLEKNQKKKTSESDKMGAYIFDLDVKNGVLRNRKYHQFIEADKSRQRKKQRFINLAIILLGKNNVMFLFDFIRKYRQKPYYSLIDSNYFSYENDRESLRLVALKETY